MYRETNRRLKIILWERPGIDSFLVYFTKLWEQFKQLFFLEGIANKDKSSMQTTVCLWTAYEKSLYLDLCRRGLYLVE